MNQDTEIERGNRHVCLFIRFTRATATIALALVLLMSGCSDTEPNQPVAAKTKGSDAGGARAHVQQYVDQLLGGNLSVQTGLLGQAGIGLNVETLEIVSSLPKYLPDGRLIPDTYTVVLNAMGQDRIKRSAVAKRIELNVDFRDGKWNIWGTEL